MMCAKGRLIMKYEKAIAEVIDFNGMSLYMNASVQGFNFRCNTYEAGVKCDLITWDSGHTCGGFTPGHCANFTGPNGEPMNDSSCPALHHPSCAHF